MKLQHFLKRVHETREQEILCSECLEQVSQFVDLELDGKPAEAVMPLFHQHIHQCPVCMEEYLLLRELAEMEQTGEPPPIEQLRETIRRKSGTNNNQGVSGL